MTTTAQIKALTAPLRRGHPHLIHIGRRLLVTPIEHVLLGVLFDRRSCKDVFVPDVFALLLHSHGVVYAIGSAIPLHHESIRSWMIDQADIEREVTASVEQFALPRLEAINSVAAFDAFVHSEDVQRWSGFGRPVERLDLAYALGDFETIDRLHMDFIAGKLDGWLIGIHDAFKDRLDLMRPLVERRDKRAMANLLREWEFENAKSLKIEKHWRPAPFPALEWLD